MQLPILITSICALAVSAYTSLQISSSPAPTATSAAAESTSIVVSVTSTAPASGPTDQATTNAANPVSEPIQVTELTSGTAFNIKWLPTAGKTVTLVLRKGRDKSLDILEVIAENLPNNGVFIWVPSTQLAGGTDYAIEITSTDPLTSNYSAQFKINSNGPGIKGKPIEPSTTRSVDIPSPTSVPKYTGTEAAPPKITDSASGYPPSSSSSGSPPPGAAFGGFGGLRKCIFAIAAICVVMIVM